MRSAIERAGSLTDLGVKLAGLYRNEGWTITRLAAWQGITPRSVKEALVAVGVELYPPNRPRRPDRRPPTSDTEGERT